MLFRGLGEEQVTGVLQVRTLVEVPLETAAEETEVFLADVRPVALLHEEVLLVHDAVVQGNTLTAFAQVRVHRLVLGPCEREELGQFHPVATVMSASLLMMQPFSTARSGNLLSSVAVFITFLILFCF